MTSFLEEVGKVKIRKGPTCSVKQMLADLPDALRPEVEAALANPKFQSTQIIQTLENLGHDAVTKHTLQRHRRGDCSCD